MDFIVDVGSIQRAIKILSIVVKANALDSTGMVLIEALEDKVIFSSNNGSTSISVKVKDVDVESTGDVALLYSRIKSFISSFKQYNNDSGAKHFRFKSDKKNTKILVDNFFNGELSKSSLTVTSMNSSVVAKPEDLGTVDFSINASVMTAAINKVLYAVNPQIGFNQPSLQGMNVRFEDGSIFFAGSDGVVLSEFHTSNSNNTDNKNITLNYDFVMGLRRLISGDSQILWEERGGKVYVEFEDVVYNGRKLIGNEFPDYKSAFDKFSHQIELEKSFLIGAISPFIDILDPDDNFRITLEIKDEIFRLYCPQAEFESKINIPSGLDFSIDLNGRILIQTIDSIKDENIIFKFSDEDGFAIFDDVSTKTQKSLISSIKKR